MKLCIKLCTYECRAENGSINLNSIFMICCLDRELNPVQQTKFDSGKP